MHSDSTIRIPDCEPGCRLDRFLQQKLPLYSRARLQEWIKKDRVLVNGAPRKSSYMLRAGDSIEVEPAELEPLHAVAEEIPLSVLYEDADVVAVDKPAGMVVHAGAGVHSGTLVNALLHRFGALSQVGGETRPGIVHRIDRFTSGVLLVAKNDAAHRGLSEQFAGRSVEKTYVALVHGAMSADSGRIERPVMRDPVRRTRMTARLEHGRSALSEYRVLHRFAKFTLLAVRIGTGRTHQIRVHLSTIGHPVAGDKLYGAPVHASGRFFLHAQRIGFAQPRSGEPVVVQAPLPPELIQWLDELEPGFRYNPV